MKRNRTALKERFKKGSIPTEADFADLIDSTLNQAEDNIGKLPNDPLRITASGSEESLLNFYRTDGSAETLSWQIKQKPGGNAGLSIGDTTAPRLFIQNSSGNLGIGSTTPAAKLDIVTEARSGSHSTTTRGLYVTGPFAADSGAAEFRKSDGTQGIGFGFNTMYASGSNANQDLGLKPRGTGKVIVSGSLQVAGGQVQIDGNQKLVFGDGDISNNLKLQLSTGFGLGINDSTLFYAANGNHSWRDASGSSAGERMRLSTAANGGLTVSGTGTSSFGGNLAINGSTASTIAANLLVNGTAQSAFAGSLAVSGNLGVGNPTPTAKLDIQLENRSGSHASGSRGLYLTGPFAADSGGLELRKSDGSEGIGIGSNTVYAAGSNANQDLTLKARGTGKVNVRGDMQVDGLITGQDSDYTKAQFTLSGGGTVSWVGSRLRWSYRFIAICMGVPTTFSAGHINITQPTSDIPASQVWNNTARSANSTGVLLNTWEALYAVHTPKGNQDAVSLRIVQYDIAFTAPANWLLVAVVNSDENSVKLGTGLVLANNTSCTQSSPIPSGIITMWSGATTSVPGGWVLCDGNNGTPNLKDRFIVGAGNAYQVGNMGGADSVTLSLAQIPSHNHSNNNFTQLLDNRSDGLYTTDGFDTTRGEPDILHSGTIQPAGGGQAHENRPPYYALAYIMKL
jgi:hypothetical protein